MRKTSNTGIELIKRFEGCRLTAYLCPAKKWTIGYGHTGYVKFFGKNVCEGMTITMEQALELLQDDLAKSEANVNSFYKRYTWNQNEFDALVSFAHNLGSINQLTANGLRSRSVIAEKMLLYVNKGTSFEAGLTVRRKAEQALFLKGVVDQEALLLSSVGLSRMEIKANIILVQKWLNQEYGEYFKKCKLTGYKLLVEDGLKGNKTRAALTIALQVHLNSLGAVLTVDGDYGTKTNDEVKKYVAVKEGTKDVSAKIVQAILYLYGYNPQAFREEFTEDSAVALGQCQRYNNLNDDEVAGIVFFATFLKQR